MLKVIAIFALAYSALNWLLFVLLTFLNDLPVLEKVMSRLSEAPAKRAPSELARAELQGLDPGKLIDSAGSLAGAFKKAGASPTAAAMSVFGLVVAGVAAGLGGH
jgi:hypothetical protein